jgi:hypothetical protein
MLTEQETADFCMIMRVVSFLQSNLAVFADAPEIMNAFQNAQRSVAELLEILDESERDTLLDQFQVEMELLRSGGPDALAGA